jgi:hypothetical protein
VYALPEDMPESFVHGCGHCGATHKYMKSEMKAFPIDEGVSLEYAPWF